MGVQYHFYPEVRQNSVWRFAAGLSDFGSEGAPRVPESLVRGAGGFVRRVCYELAPERGFPPDLSPELRDWVSFLRTMAEIEHASWVYVAELIAFDWHNTFDQKQWWEDDVPARLFPFSQWPPPQGSTLPAPPTAEELRVSYAQRARSFLLDVLPRLQAMGDPLDVRVVFFCDYD